MKKNIAKHRRIKNLFQKANKTALLISENAPFGIYIVNKKGDVEYVNPAMLRISDTTQEQFEGLNMLDSPVYHEIDLTGKIKAALRGEYFRLNDVEYTSYLSRKTTVRNIIGIPLEEEGEKKVLIFVEDVTERQRLERLKDEFVSTVSHELRTPLSIMKEGVSQVLEGMHGEINEKQKHFLSVVIASIDRVTHIISGLLDISKIQAGKFVLKNEAFNIVELTRAINKIFEIPTQGKGLKLKENYPEKEIKVYADKDRISQVLVNLIGNAIKFTERGYIETKILEKHNFIECSITDTGIGISEENLAKLFNNFEQFNRANGPGEKGIGLGLPIAKGIVELHGGRIWAKSRPNQGTKFTFTLPKKYII